MIPINHRYANFTENCVTGSQNVFYLKGSDKNVSACLWSHLNPFIERSGVMKTTPLSELCSDADCEVWRRPSVSNAKSLLQWRHNERDGVSNHRRLDCLIAQLFVQALDQRKHQSSVSLAFVRGTGGFPSQRTSNAENVFIWWRHHVPILLRFIL